MNIYEQFLWFMGVVEDNNDPLFIGRCRVRCFNYHTEDLAELPTENLPWAQVIRPSSGGSVGDIGFSGNGILKGSWVVGFFADGDMKQRPFIIGTIPAYPLDEADASKGYSDPNAAHPYRTKEADSNRMGRESEEDHPSIPVREERDDLTDEPVPNRDSVYPFNNIWETQSGHFLEMDDTPGANRITMFHNSGTYNEVHPDGTKVNRVVANNYSIIYGDDYLRVRGNVNIFVDGNSNIYTRQNTNLQVDGNLRTIVGGDYDLDVTGNYTVTAGGTMLHESEGTYDVNTESTYTLRAARVDINSGSDDITFYSAKDIRGYYCIDAVFLNVCIFTPPSDVTPVPAIPYPATPIPEIEYGPRERVINSEVRTGTDIQSTSSAKDFPTNSAPLTGDETKKPESDRDLRGKKTEPGGTYTGDTGGLIDGFTEAQTRCYLGAVGKRESNNNYGAVNSFGYAGKYQFGRGALVDTGYLKSSSPRGNRAAMGNSSNWTGKDGVNSLDDWLANKGNAQENAMINYTNRNKTTLRRINALNGSETASEQGGMLMTSHLLGAGGAKKWRNGQGKPDGYGTTGDEYYTIGSKAIDKCAG